MVYNSYAKLKFSQEPFFIRLFKFTTCDLSFNTLTNSAAMFESVVSFLLWCLTQNEAFLPQKKPKHKIKVK